MNNIHGNRNHTAGCCLAVLLTILSASVAFAQNDPAQARMAAGCGPNEINFEVKTDKKLHPTGQPAAGKALVYIFANTFIDTGVNIGTKGIVTRFGLDGAWVGATQTRSYFFFQADPGDHRLCTSWQSSLKSRNAVGAAITFTAEAGKTYSFMTKTPEAAAKAAEEVVKLVPVDPAEAQLLISQTPYSTFHQK